MRNYEGCVHILRGQLLYKYRIFLIAALPLYHLQVLAKVQEAFVSLLALVSTQQKAAASLGMQPAGTNTDTPGSSSSSSSGEGVQPGIAQTTAAAAAPVGAATAAAGTLLESEALLLRTAQSVLSIAPSRKGRYQPLTALLPYLGASVLLKLQPGLVAETIEAMQSNLCASAAAGFFKALLLQLRTELSTDSTPVLQQQQRQGAVNGIGRTAGATTAPAAVSAGGDELLSYVPASMRAWCRFWLPDLLSALWAQGERARTYVANYALPMVLQAEPNLLQPMVDTILAAHAADTDAAAGAGVTTSTTSTPGDSSRGAAGVRDAAAALVVVLRTGRRLQLVGDLDVLLPQAQDAGSGGGGSAGLDEASVAMSPAGLLLSAASSATAPLRIEALELVCISAR